jgi:hypothetical protein
MLIAVKWVVYYRDEAGGRFLQIFLNFLRWEVRVNSCCRSDFASLSIARQCHPSIVSRILPIFCKPLKFARLKRRKNQLYSQSEKQALAEIDFHNLDTPSE